MKDYSDGIWDDGEWISWDWINGQLADQELQARRKKRMKPYKSKEPATSISCL